MNFKNKKGLTLAESLVAIFLLSTLLVSILGAFFISKSSTLRAKHRATAMNIVREYLEKEISSGYYFGIYQTFAAEDPVVRTIDGVDYSIAPYPYPPTIYTEGSSNFKLLGFRVTWSENLFNQAGGVSCNERAIVYIAQR